MDYLQYCFPILVDDQGREISFKPCYKWITFNTAFNISAADASSNEVLNLVINGLPSILSFFTPRFLYIFIEF